MTFVVPMGGHRLPRGVESPSIYVKSPRWDLKYINLLIVGSFGELRLMKSQSGGCRKFQLSQLVYKSVVVGPTYPTGLRWEFMCPMGHYRRLVLYKSHRWE